MCVAFALNPEKSESNIHDNTSEFKSIKETTEDDRGYEVINAKEYHKDNEFNQFDVTKERAMTHSEYSPQSPRIAISD